MQKRTEHLNQSKRTKIDSQYPGVAPLQQQAKQPFSAKERGKKLVKSDRKSCINKE